MVCWLRLALIAVTFFLLVVAENPEQQGLYNETTESDTNALTYGVKKLEEFWSNFTSYSKRVFDRITDPVAKLFRKNDEENSTKVDETLHDKKEHGRLSAGRELFKDIKRRVDGTVDKVSDMVGSTVNKIEETLGFKHSNESKGLDSDKSFFSGVVDSFKDKVKAIFPGTKWCGDGNNAKSYDDLGTQAEVDKCCREHDNCNISIPAGETQYGLINTGLFTRSHCDCDQKFYNCLKTTNTFTAGQIGTTYFTVIGPQCFKKEKRILNCTESKGGKCIKYATENSGEQFYQWFDNPNY